MKILRAEELGMCFGVRDALHVLDQVSDPTAVTIHGELVHNPEVLRDLDRRGFTRSPEGERQVPEKPVVLVTAHGISERERTRLEAAGKQLIDTTCPLVQKAHAAAQQLQRQGCRVVVLGKRDHVEVLGIIEDLTDAIVVTTAANVATWPDAHLGVVVHFADTICSPTKARVDALRALLPRIDALVVVGGHNSNNTKQLVASAAEQGVPALHIERASELDDQWFDGRAVVGLTAGTSTLARTIDEVHEALLAIAQRQRGLPASTTVRRTGRSQPL